MRVPASVSVDARSWRAPRCCLARQQARCACPPGGSRWVCLPDGRRCRQSGWHDGAVRRCAEPRCDQGGEGRLGGGRGGLSAPRVTTPFRARSWDVRAWLLGPTGEDAHGV